ncbi:MAG: hypothetical protein ACI9NQ_001900 [Paracoccaceae bacterium]|jgi:hypothetical protein
MAFTEQETSEHLKTLEDHFWTHRRPPLHLRDKIREGQRIEDQSIELFLVRPIFNHPEKFVEGAIAKITYVQSKEHWKIFWKRADGKWHTYPPKPTAPSLEKALATVHDDPNGCFFG